MTQKEKLLKELKEIQYDIALEKGETPQQIVESHLVWEAKNYRVADLKQEIEYARENLAKAKQAKAVKEYFATPKGMQKKEILMTRTEELRNQLMETRDTYASKIRAMLLGKLGRRWVIKSNDVSYVEVILTDEAGERIFGHRFELSLFDEYGKDDKISYELHANIGTMGGFNVHKDSNMLSLYTAFSSVVSDKELMTQIKDLMMEFSQIRDDIRNELFEIKRIFENPKF